MEHKEAIEQLQKRWQKNKKECESLLKTLLQLIGDTTTMMHGVMIANFGVFLPIKTLERIGIDSDTNTRMLLPPEIRLTYTASCNDAASEQCISESDLAMLLAKRTTIPLQEATEIVVSLFDLIAQACNNGESVVVHNLGVFSPRWVATSERYEREFAPDKQMREWVNAPFASFSPEPLANEEASIEETEIEEEVVASPTEIEEEQPIEKETVTPTIPEPTEVNPKKKGKSRRKYIVLSISLIAAIALGGFYQYTQIVETEKSETIAVVEEPIESEPIVVEEPVVVEEPAPIVETIEPEIVDTIRRGVFMTTLSLKHYGHKAFWVYIYEENRALIKNPNAVPPNTPVVIPPKGKYDIDANNPAAIKRALKRAEEITKTL